MIDTLSRLLTRGLLVLALFIAGSSGALAKNVIVLLVEKPAGDNLALTIATTQTAWEKFRQSEPGEAELAIISYANTPDVVRPLAAADDVDTAALGDILKRAGSRGETINTAAGLERAVSLLTSESTPQNRNFLLVISDALIATGNAGNDQQFTEWMVDIISDDARKAAIDVQWHPISKNAQHATIDAFLGKLDGNRVVVTPDETLIDDAEKPLPKSAAEAELEKLTAARAELGNPAPQTEPGPATTALLEDPQTQPNPDPAIETSEPAPPLPTPVATNADSITDTDTDAGTDLDPAPLTEPAPEDSLNPDLIKYGIFGIILLLAGGLLFMLINRRSQSDEVRPNLAEKEFDDEPVQPYDDDIFAPVAATGAVAVSTQANAPIIPPRELIREEKPLEPDPPAAAPEPLPQPQPAIDEPKIQAVTEEAENVEAEDSIPSMDSTQEIFPEFSSASLSAVETIDSPATESLVDDQEAGQQSSGDVPEQTPEEPAPVANARTEIDPYATVIADSEKLRQYAHQFTAAPDTEPVDDDKTILAPGTGAAARFSGHSDDDEDDDKTVLVRPGDR
ncbi:MAG: VWA domain-containing protein [Gammaproteobacteria bacterium]|nr:VWA domain-containing protein [Gammaproteobacteria bacterium]